MLDLDHIGAEVAEVHRDAGAGYDRRAVDDAQARERKVGHVSSIIAFVVNHVTRQRIVAGSTLVATLIAHAFTPTNRAPENLFGYVSGYSALIALLVALAGLVMRRDWGRKLLGLMGAAIAAGFAVLHGLPYRNFLTDPYVGRHPAVGLVQWTVVLLAIAAGIWCAMVSMRKPAEVAVPA